jgi:hypothetical protein
VTEHTGAGANFKGSSASRNEKAYAPLHNGATANRPRMRLLRWRPLVKNSLRGFATVQLPGLVIYDVSVFISGGKGGWSSLGGRDVLLVLDNDQWAPQSAEGWVDRSRKDHPGLTELLAAIAKRVSVGDPPAGGSEGRSRCAPARADQAQPPPSAL